MIAAPKVNSTAPSSGSSGTPRKVASSLVQQYGRSDSDSAADDCHSHHQSESQNQPPSGNEGGAGKSQDMAKSLWWGADDGDDSDVLPGPHIGASRQF